MRRLASAGSMSAIADGSMAVSASLMTSRSGLMPRVLMWNSMVPGVVDGARLLSGEVARGDVDLRQPCVRLRLRDNPSAPNLAPLHSPQRPSSDTQLPLGARPAISHGLPVGARSALNIHDKVCRHAYRYCARVSLARRIDLYAVCGVGDRSRPATDRAN